ncbi:MAG: DUF5069 domain-containing protein [Nitrospirota bacterium]|nr:DUF5069 domain-containing protein [Nitrospirota bacterium]
MDLRTQFPRSPKDKLAGYVHLPRMLDKCRATLAGTQGEYIYPCPMDQLLLAFAGIAAEQFTEAARGMTDTALAEWFKKTAIPHSKAEIDRWNAEFLTYGPDTDEKRAYFNKLRDAADPSRTDTTAWADLLDLDEQRPVPKRTANVR